MKRYSKVQVFAYAYRVSTSDCIDIGLLSYSGEASSITIRDGNVVYTFNISKDHVNFTVRRIREHRWFETVIKDDYTISCLLAPYKYDILNVENRFCKRIVNLKDYAKPSLRI